MMHKKILVTGGTGMIGRRMVDLLSRDGAYVRVLARDVDKAKAKFEKNYTVEILKWNSYENPLGMKDIMEGTDAIINLAGTNVGDKRWTKKFKEEIYHSRVDTTKLLVDTIRICKDRPKVFLSASGVGVYGFRGDETLDENSSTGDDFLAKVCRDWENEAMKAIEFNLRVVVMRTGLVLEKNEGALNEMAKPFKFFAGGKYGSGRQWLSWIHIDDVIRLYINALQSDLLFGPVNATSPDPVTNKQFIKMLGKALKRPSIFPVPSFALKLVAGEFANNLLTGQRVIPAKAIRAGFEFKFPELKMALENLLKTNS